MISKKNISAALRKLGVPPSLHGFDYIITAIELIDKDNHYRYQSCELYSDVAKIHGIKYMSCERCMRHAIEVSFKYAGYEILEVIFGSAYDPEKGRPTVSEFLTCLYEYLRYES